MTEWQSIDTAPRDGSTILAYCDHEAAPYSEGHMLTLYAAHAEGMSHAGTGLRIITWGGSWSDSADDGGGWLPDWWFVAESEFEVAANPTHWMPLPAPPCWDGQRRDDVSEITEQDRERARSIEWVQTTIDDHDAIAATFAAHRAQARKDALDEAEKACRAGAYSPAPYTTIKHALAALRTTPTTMGASTGEAG